MASLPLVRQTSASYGTYPALPTFRVTGPRWSPGFSVAAPSAPVVAVAAPAVTVAPAAGALSPLTEYWSTVTVTGAPGATVAGAWRSSGPWSAQVGAGPCSQAA